MDVFQGDTHKLRERYMRNEVIEERGMNDGVRKLRNLSKRRYYILWMSLIGNIEDIEKEYMRTSYSVKQKR